jgi:sugar lactone lactonase YvrE
VRAFAQAPSAESTTRGSGSTFSFGAFAAMLVCAAALLGIGAPAASAAPEATPGYGYATSFGKGTLSPEFFAPPRSPIAIGADGKIFVVNQNQGTIVVFGASKITAEAFPITSIGSGVLPTDVAVDPSDDTVYAQDRGPLTGVPKTIRLLSDGKATPTYTEDPGFEIPAGEGIAVDPTTHDLLVTTGDAETILRYDTAGNLLDTIATPGLAPRRIAVAEDGSIYVSGDTSLVTHLSGAGLQLDQIDVGSAPEALAVDWTTGVIVVGFPGHLLSYTPAGALESETDSPTDAANVGAAIDPVSGRLYSYIGSLVDLYVPGLQPDVENFTVSDVQNHSAHLSAEVDPGYVGNRPGLVFLEYSADGGNTWTVTPPTGVEMYGPGTVEFDIEHLLVNTDYLARLKVRNEHIVSITQPLSFSTPEVTPEVITGSATDIGETSAVINGAVNPAGFPTTYHFEWGLTSSYGSRLPIAEDAPAGQTRNSTLYRYRLTGLTPGTTYHFRIVAQNTLGVSYGADRTFTTSAVGGVPLRAYEQVTPQNKQGNPLDPGIGFYAREDGNAFAYMNRGGESSSPNMPFAMSRRGATDWESGIDLTDPLTVLSYVPGALVGTTLIGISPDFTHAFVGSNRALTPGAFEKGTNLYVKDLATGSYRLVVGKEDPFGILNFILVQSQNKFIASAPDLSWVIFYSPVPLVDGASGGELYRWSESGGLEVVSVLPDGDFGQVDVAASFLPGTKSVSADGSRVYFTVLFGSEAGVFLRENGKPTKSISVSQAAGEPTTSRSARLLGISKDGRYAFFSAREGKLTDDAPGTNGDVYRYDAVDGSLEYLGGRAADITYAGVGIADDGGTAYWINPVPSGPNETPVDVWRNGVVHQVAPGAESAAGDFPSMSHNGRYLGYQERGTAYLYDADKNESSCASCLPDGSPAPAFTFARERFNSSRHPQAVTEDGALFFTSEARLAAGDTNGARDVYMFKNGQPSLISPGNGPFDAIFGEVTPSGNDVFFSTAQKLVGRDDDQSTDIYDARIGGGLASQNPPPTEECLRDDCKATPNAGPELPFGGSEALAGPENVHPKKGRKHCGKNRRAVKKKGKVRCVKKHRAGKARRGAHR